MFYWYKHGVIKLKKANINAAIVVGTYMTGIIISKTSELSADVGLLSQEKRHSVSNTNKAERDHFRSFRGTVKVEQKWACHKCKTNAWLEVWHKAHCQQ